MGHRLKNWIKSVTTPMMRGKVKLVLLRLRCGRWGKTARPAAGPWGVNLVGHIRGDYGLGESCRLLAAAMDQAEIPFSIRQVDNGRETNPDWRHRESSKLDYGINLVHVNPPQLHLAVDQVGAKALLGRYTIGFWMWEQPELPREWTLALEVVDEVWTATEFVAAAIRRCTRKPVFVMPYGFLPPVTEKHCGRAFFGLPEGVCLFMLSYDGKSSSDRKNPLASVRAYCSAFGPEESGVGLVIKATNAEPGDLEEVRRMTAGRPNVVILTQNYTKPEFNSLIRAADVYVSLHRAEGFGLVMAEAMLLGTAVIATDWSGNTEFMNPEVACMVPAELVTLEKDSPPYRAGSRWAQPDEAAAADFMRRLYRQPEERAAMCRRARAYMERERSVQQAGTCVARRLEQLKTERF